MDWMKSNRRSELKTVDLVVPLPGSGSSSQGHDAKSKTLNGRKSNKTMDLDNSPMPSEVTMLVLTWAITDMLQNVQQILIRIGDVMEY